MLFRSSCTAPEDDRPELQGLRRSMDAAVTRELAKAPAQDAPKPVARPTPEVFNELRERRTQLDAIGPQVAVGMQGVDLGTDLYGGAFPETVLSLQDAVRIAVRAFGLNRSELHTRHGLSQGVTFPRVLGYVFNPVSFWFCHRANGELRAIVCEVSNTFGERHCYLLDTGGAMQWGMMLTAKKIFHVSPFCAVEGRYRFRFMRTTQHVGEEDIERIVARIDYDDAQGPLLLTSISGQLQPLTTASTARAFVRHPLMTLGVIARIHWQALKLFIKRVPFFSKPIPPQKALSR